MALDLLLDPNTKDLDLSGGRVNFSSSLPTVARQRIEGAVSLVRGTWFLDLLAGLDWLALLRQKQVEPIQRAVTDAVLGDPDVASASIQVVRGPDRSVEVTGVARLASGETATVNTTVG